MGYSAFPGMFALARTSPGGLILSLLINRAIKGDSEPISIGSLQGLTFQKREEILATLKELADRGVLTFDADSNTLPEVETLCPIGLSIKLHLIEQVQKPLDFKKPDPKPAPAKPGREETCEDEAFLGNIRFLGKVDPFYEGNEDEPSYFRLTITRFEPLGVPFDVVQNEPFDTKRLAWEYFDEYVKPAPTRLETGKDEVELDGCVYSAYVTENGGFTYLSVRKESFEGEESVEETLVDAVEFETKELAWAHFDTIAPRPVAEAVPESDADEEPAGDNVTALYSEVLELDEEFFTVLIEPTGARTASVKISGPVNELGEFIAKIKRKDLEDDPAGWAVKKIASLVSEFKSAVAV